MTTEKLAPKWAGQFDSFVKWINHANIWLQSTSQQPAVCIDAKGRRCSTGKDFMRARDEDTFPVRYFWEFEVAAKPIVPTVEQVEDVVGMGSNAWDCVPPAALIEAVLWCAGMQPPNNQPNSDHVAVISAEPESRLTDECQTAFEKEKEGDTFRDTVEELVASDYFAEGWKSGMSLPNTAELFKNWNTCPGCKAKWKEMSDNAPLVKAHREFMAKEEKVLQSGIGLLDGRPNEQKDFRCMEIGCGSTTEGVHHQTCPEAAAGSQEGKQ